MKILEIAPDFPPVVRGGGAQTFLLLADSWTRLGHEVTVLTSCPENMLHIFSNEDYPFKLHIFALVDPPKGMENLTYHMPVYLRSFKSLRGWLRSQQASFDLIVVHGFMETLSLISLMTFSQSTLKKVVLTNHGLSVHWGLFGNSDWSINPFRKIVGIASK